jgi:hypothetical protein
MTINPLGRDQAIHLIRNSCDELRRKIDSHEQQMLDIIIAAAYAEANEQCSVMATSKPIPKDALVEVITLQLPSYAKPGGTYKVREFREHCAQFLPIGPADLKKDRDGSPCWYGRFVYSHNQITKRRGFTTDGHGTWFVPS